MKKSGYRITLSIASILHMLFIFLLPYGKLPGLLDSLSGLAGAANVYYPKYLTGYGAIRYAAVAEADEQGIVILVAIIYAIPVIMGFFMLLMMLLGKKRLSYIGFVVMSGFMLLGYFIIMMFSSIFFDMGYVPTWFSYVLVIGIVIAQFVVGIVGCVKDPGPGVPVKASAKKAKAEKKAEKPASKIKVPPAENDIFGSKREVPPAQNDIFGSKREVPPAQNDIFGSKREVPPVQNDIFASKKEAKPSENNVFSSGQKWQPVKNETPIPKKAEPVQNDIFASRMEQTPAQDDIFSSMNRAQQVQKEGTMRCISGEHTGIVIQVPSGMAAMIGRDPAVCNVVLSGEYVSRRHCSVMYDPENNTYRVTDFSANGVFDGKGGRLPSNQVVSLPAGSEINIENNIFRLG